MSRELDKKIAELLPWTDDAWMPKWSTDIELAWGLLEDLKVLCCQVSKEVCCGTRYDAVIYDDPGMEGHVHAMADTAAEAICLAWIKWKEKI